MILWLQFLPLLTNACCIMPGPGPRAPEEECRRISLVCGNFRFHPQKVLGETPAFVRPVPLEQRRLLWELLQQHWIGGTSWILWTQAGEGKSFTKSKTAIAIARSAPRAPTLQSPVKSKMAPASVCRVKKTNTSNTQMTLPSALAAGRVVKSTVTCSVPKEWLLRGAGWVWNWCSSLCQTDVSVQCSIPCAKLGHETSIQKDQEDGAHGGVVGCWWSFDASIAFLLGMVRCGAGKDQVELSPCRAVSDTQCACRNGTFCSPDHPCEMCQKCRPRCPEGEVEQAPCTPHSDRQCGPPTGTVPKSSYTWIIPVGICAGLVLLFLISLCLYCVWRSRGGGRDLSGKSCSVLGYLMRQLTRYRRGGLGTQDNMRNEQFSRDQLLPRASGSVTPSAPGLEVMVPRTSYPSVQPRRNLVPVQGKDPITVLRRSFDIFARDVPYKDWKRYGRALDLLENDIALAELNDKYSLEPFFQMLNTWQNRQGMNASVNTLLETLHQINLGGIAEDISSKLVQQGYFQYEVS